MYKRRLKPRIGDLILRALVASAQVLGDIDAVLTNPYKYTHGLPYKPQVVENAVQRLVRTGYLSREGRGRKANYRITDKGEERVRKQISKYLLEQVSWDGKWRMVIFDIEESHRVVRDRLRRFLRSVGFGYLQRSIWISPFPAREILGEFLEESGLADVALVVEADYVAGWENKELASRVWGLSDLSKRYSRFAQECEKAKEITEKLQKKFERLVVGDPFLPFELLPENWDRERAFRAYNSLLEKESSEKKS